MGGQNLQSFGALALEVNIYFSTENFKAMKLLKTFCSEIYDASKIHCARYTLGHTEPVQIQQVWLEVLRQATKWIHLCLLQQCSIPSGSQVAITPLCSLLYPTLISSAGKNMTAHNGGHS